MTKPSHNPARDILEARRRAQRPDLTEIDGRRFAELVKSGRDLRLSGFRTPDLAQIRWPDDVMGGDIRDVELVSVHWRGRRDRPATMTDVTFTDCIVDPFDVWDAVLSRCTFVDCQFGLLVVGGVHDGAIVDSTFRGCRLGEWYVNGSRFERTRFSAIRSGTLSFRKSHFTDVTFAGRPGVLEFDECRFHDLDLSGANPERLQITRPLRGSRATMFERPDHFVVAAEDLPPLRPIAAGSVSERAFADFATFVSAFGSSTGAHRWTQSRPSLVDVRPRDVVRDPSVTAGEREVLVDLVRRQRIVRLEIG